MSPSVLLCVALRQFSDSQTWQKEGYWEAKKNQKSKIWLPHDSIMQVRGSHRGSSHLCIVMMLQLIPDSGIISAIGCLLKGLRNLFLYSICCCQNTKWRRGGGKRPRRREYAILYALLGALLDFLQQQQKRLLITFVPPPTTTKMANKRNAV